MAPSKKDDKKIHSKEVNTENGHQFQAGSSDNDEWKHKEPYRIHDKDAKFETKWKGHCHCGRVEYELSRKIPLDAKYCHCTTCQRLHGAPFQWAAIFHKSDINFTNGIHDLGWYESSEKSIEHKLPCKVSCAFCRTPIMDEGRNMILLFPTLIEGINIPEGRKAFKPACHMFYTQRVCDVKDGHDKWSGLDYMSDQIDDDGNVIQKYHEGMKEEMETKKRKRQEHNQEDAKSHKKKWEKEQGPNE